MSLLSGLRDLVDPSGRSIQGFAGNLIGDVGEFAGGMAGLAGQAISNPTQIPGMVMDLPGAMVDDISNRYGMLLPGGRPAGEFGGAAYEDPAFFGLDALGAYGLARGGRALGRAQMEGQAIRRMDPTMSPEAGTLRPFAQTGQNPYPVGGGNIETMVKTMHAAGAPPQVIDEIMPLLREDMGVREFEQIWNYVQSRGPQGGIQAPVQRQPGPHMGIPERDYQAYGIPQARGGQFAPSPNVPPPSGPIGVPQVDPASYQGVFERPPVSPEEAGMLQEFEAFKRQQAQAQAHAAVQQGQYGVIADPAAPGAPVPAFNPLGPGPAGGPGGETAHAMNLRGLTTTPAEPGAWVPGFAEQPQIFPPSGPGVQGPAIRTPVGSPPGMGHELLSDPRLVAELNRIRELSPEAYRQMGMSSRMQPNFDDIAAYRNRPEGQQLELSPEASGQITPEIAQQRMADLDAQQNRLGRDPYQAAPNPELSDLDYQLRQNIYQGKPTGRTIRGEKERWSAREFPGNDPFTTKPFAQGTARQGSAMDARGFQLQKSASFQEAQSLAEMRLQAMEAQMGPQAAREAVYGRIQELDSILEQAYRAGQTRSPEVTAMVQERWALGQALDRTAGVGVQGGQQGRLILPGADERTAISRSGDAPTYLEEQIRMRGGARGDEVIPTLGVDNAKLGPLTEQDQLVRDYEMASGQSFDLTPEEVYGKSYEVRLPNEGDFVPGGPQEVRKYRLSPDEPMPGFTGSKSGRRGSFGQTSIGKGGSVKTTGGATDAANITPDVARESARVERQAAKAAEPEIPVMDPPDVADGYAMYLEEKQALPTKKELQAYIKERIGVDVKIDKTNWPDSDARKALREEAGIGRTRNEGAQRRSEQVTEDPEVAKADAEAEAASAAEEAATSEWIPGEPLDQTQLIQEAIQRGIEEGLRRAGVAPDALTNTATAAKPAAAAAPQSVSGAVSVADVKAVRQKLIDQAEGQLPKGSDVADELVAMGYTPDEAKAAWKEYKNTRSPSERKAATTQRRSETTQRRTTGTSQRQPRAENTRRAQTRSYGTASTKDIEKAYRKLQDELGENPAKWQVEDELGAKITRARWSTLKKQFNE